MMTKESEGFWFRIFALKTVKPRQIGQKCCSAGQKQINHPEIVSHEIQGKVSVRTEILVGA
jgi:hypothetical protein